MHAVAALSIYTQRQYLRNRWVTLTLTPFRVSSNLSCYAAVIFINICHIIYTDILFCTLVYIIYLYERLSVSWRVSLYLPLHLFLRACTNLIRWINALWWQELCYYNPIFVRFSGVSVWSSEQEGKHLTVNTNMSPEQHGWYQTLDSHILFIFRWLNRLCVWKRCHFPSIFMTLNSFTLPCVGWNQYLYCAAYWLLDWWKSLYNYMNDGKYWLCLNISPPPPLKHTHTFSLSLT